MAILMLRGFFRQLPHELWEAARVDGCGYFQFYLRVTLRCRGRSWPRSRSSPWSPAGTTTCCR